MTSTDVVKIINACSKGGVKHLEFNGLVLDFNKNRERWEDWQETPVKKEDVQIGFNPPKAIEKYKEIGDTDIVEDNEPVTEEELEELKITNPPAYEELMENMNA